MTSDVLGSVQPDQAGRGSHSQGTDDSQEIGAVDKATKKAGIKLKKFHPFPASTCGRLWGRDPSANSCLVMGMPCKSHFSSARRSRCLLRRYRREAGQMHGTLPRTATTLSRLWDLEERNKPCQAGKTHMHGLLLSNFKKIGSFSNASVTGTEHDKNA